MRGLLIASLVLLAMWVLAAIVLTWLGRKWIARELLSFIPNVARLFRDLLRDDRVPRSSKSLLVLGAAWIASPIDLIPEFLPAIGPLDDVVVAGLVLRHLVRRAGPDVVRDHWRGDPRALGLLLRLARAPS
jgi:uncharacterized membrane protein YkvA (DUF1232 family)